jgi:DNA-binding CsgD family transcriptional regulator
MTESHRYSSGSGRKDRSQSQAMIVFWGDALRFPDGVLRLAETEAGEMKVRRLARLDDLDAHGNGRRFIFFDDDVAEDVLADPHRWLAGQPLARWILAYRDEHTARRLLTLRRSDPSLAPFGLLPMNLPIDQWVPMFRLVLSGNCFVPAGFLDHHTDGDSALSAGGGDLGAVLTPREREVLTLVAEGKRNKTIAHELGLSEHTIKLHLHNVITKINVRNRTQAAQWFLTRQFGRVR